MENEEYTDNEEIVVTGAYVQAWVYVRLEDKEYTDEEIRDIARAQYHADGEIEIDSDGKVSVGDYDW